jgi:hypothetical protein
VITANVKLLYDYLKAIFVESRQWVLTLFDILGIVLFLLPNLSSTVISSAEFTRGIGISILVISFIAANLRVFRQLKLAIPFLDEDSLALYQYTSGPYNAIEMHYFGKEPAKDLSVAMLYVDPDGTFVEKSVEQFFPAGDRAMTWSHYKANTLAPGAVCYFHLIRRKSAPSGEVTVTAGFVGAHSRIEVRTSKRFELTQ